MTSTALVIVHDLDIFGARVRPSKADPELIVYADAVLSCAVSLQRLETVPRWDTQILKKVGDLQLPELATCR